MNYKVSKQTEAVTFFVLGGHVGDGARKTTRNPKHGGEKTFYSDT